MGNASARLTYRRAKCDATDADRRPRGCSSEDCSIPQDSHHHRRPAIEVSHHSRCGARDPDGLEAREIYVEMSGPDAVLLTQRGGELLRALEHIAAKIVRLEAEEHDVISFDANNFKAIRARELKLAAETAAERVRGTSQPYSFAPMSSRERRMLHLAFRDYADLETESSGEGLRRFVVVYPKGAARLRPRPSEVGSGPRPSRRNSPY